MKYRSHQEGQIAIATAVFLFLISSTVVLGLAVPVYKEVKNSNDFTGTRESYYLSEALNEDLTYRVKSGKVYSSSHSLTLNTFTATGTVTTITGGKEILTTGNRRDSLRRIKTILTDSVTGVAFNYGVQSGTGGVVLENTSSIKGNLYSNGPVSGSDNYIYGDVVSAGLTGSITNITATSSSYARTIVSSNICGNAYYQSIDSSSLNFLNTPTTGTCKTPTTPGTAFPGSPNQPVIGFPISDTQITDWEIVAAEGGNAICTGGKYTITANTNLGPKKIPCDLEIQNNPTITLYGHVWVEGNIIIKNTAIINISPSLGNQSIAIIADKPSNNNTSATIQLENSISFGGSGSPNSYILLVSQNNSAEVGGSTVAIDVKNSVTGALLVYAAHGEVQLQNSISLKEVTAYRIRAKNTAQVVYQTGIANMIFSSGPAGGFDISGWQEVQ